MNKPRGPVPKPSSQRRRRNKPEGAAPAKPPARRVVAAPSPDPEWHPIALDWFNSLEESGQAQFYEASDWMTARYIAEAGPEVQFDVVLGGVVWDDGAVDDGGRAAACPYRA
jgi:hypothetical protein